MVNYSKQQIQQLVVIAANKYGVNPKLALAVAQQESGFNPNAKSSVGARGVMQLMPNTAKGFGIDINNVEQNIDTGVRMLAGLQRKYGNDIPRVLAAYNAGSGAVDDYLYGTNKTGQNPRHRKGVMPYDGTGYKETKGYVNNIISMIQNPKSVVNKVWDVMKLTNPNLAMLDRNINLGAKTLRYFQGGTSNQPQESQVAGNQVKGTPTGEAAGLPDTTQVDSGLSTISLPELSYTAPTVNPPSGVATDAQVQKIINELPTQFQQDYRNYVQGLITKDQFVALHGDDLAKAGIDVSQLKDMTPFTPRALTEADRIAQQLQISPETINQLNQQTYSELGKQRDLVTQQQQGMVDRLNAMQQRYDDIINSDPRLQTGQGYSVDPRDIASNNAAQVANQIGGFGMNLPTAEALAKQRYEAQLSNQLGVPYADYLAARQQAIQNQLALAPNMLTAQNQINAQTQQMVDQLTQALGTMSKFGYDALTDNQKNLVDLYKPILQNMTSGEYKLQENLQGQPLDIAGARVQTLGNIYDTDVKSMTTTTGNVLANQAANQRNAYDYLIGAANAQEQAKRTPYYNLGQVGMGLAGLTQSGIDPSAVSGMFGNTGINIPQQETYQPQGLNWGFGRRQ